MGKHIIGGTFFVAGQTASINFMDFDQGLWKQHTRKYQRSLLWKCNGMSLNKNILIKKKNSKLFFFKAHGDVNVKYWQKSLQFSVGFSLQGFFQSVNIWNI